MATNTSLKSPSASFTLLCCCETIKTNVSTLIMSFPLIMTTTDNCTKTVNKISSAHVKRPCKNAVLILALIKMSKYQNCWSNFSFWSYESVPCRVSNSMQDDNKLLVFLFKVLHVTLKVPEGVSLPPPLSLFLSVSLPSLRRSSVKLHQLTGEQQISALLLLSEQTGELTPTTSSLTPGATI